MSDRKVFSKMAAETPTLLDFESAMFLELTEEDGLFVTARGINISRVLTNFLKMYCDPAALVIVVNASDYEESHITNELKTAGVPVPKVITTEFTSAERESIYLSGGVLFVTSRILVVDMLTKKLPIHLVTGIIVFKAHKIIESCQEAFILRLYRENNKTGFIKAFSDQPTSFSSGFCKVERVMKNLFVRKLSLWPRFHASISAVLEKHKPDVVELHLQLSPSMTAIQMAILDLMSNCLKEIRRANPSLDADELTVENSIHKAFDKQLRFQLNPVWHHLSSKTRQLVADLKVLRLILFYLTQYDCVTFYTFLESLRTNQPDATRQSLWMYMDATDSLFVHAKERVYGSTMTQKTKRQKTENNPEKPKTDTDEGDDDEWKMEESPKWKLLAEIVEEIEKDEEKNKDLGPGHILVAAYDERTCYQLKEYLCHGSKTLLTRILNKMIKDPANSIPDPIIPADLDIDMDVDDIVEDTGTTAKQTSSRTRRGKGAGRGKGRGKRQVDDKQTRLDEIRDQKETRSNQDNKTEQANTRNIILRPEETKWDKEDQGSDVKIVSSPVIVIHPLVGCSDPYSLIKTLEEMEPRYVILYDADVEFVRQLEIYKASRPGVPLRVYFMIYSGSVEEQKYLTTLRKEKDAFEMLIKEKGVMVVPEEREGKTEAAMALSRDVTKATDVLNTRKAGGRDDEAKQAQTRRVIVDMREFRSELPSLIHRRGIDIEPVTLEVGDYILSPDMCVERKSVGDLISSLNSGRLYNQAVSMTRFYKRPVLLIEFDQNKSFSLQTMSSVSNEISIQNVTSKLALLTIHFPKLRILWCHSPYATAELFDDLKDGHPEPDAETAMSIGTDSTSVSDVKYNIGPQDFILKLPGINSKNYKYLMNQVKDIHELCELSEDRLTEILDNSSVAKTLWEFLHAKRKGLEKGISATTTRSKNKKN